jgi:hypothetical protein
MTATPPTRVVLRDGGTVFAAMTYETVRRVVEIARRRGEDKVRLNGRILDVDRITHVLAPTKEHAE